MKENRETKQRKLIYKVIKSACFYPNAEQIYNLAKRENEKISIATVYRNLEVLVYKGLIKRIDIANEASRFDADVNKCKAYFISSKNGSIYDLDFKKEKLKNFFKESKIIKSIDKANIIIYGEISSNIKSKKIRKGKINLKSC